MPSTYGEYRSIFQGKQMPFAFVDLDLLDQNIEAVLQRAGNKQIRIASKSIRCTAILRYIFASNPRFQGVMSYSVLEAVHLSQSGFDDLLVAYPAWHAEQIGLVCEQVKQGKTITLMVDSLEHIAQLDRIASAHQVRLPVCMDIDLSYDLPMLHFGVWRSPITSPETALKVYRAIAESSSLYLDGVMGYEAQIAGVGDGGKSARNRVIRWLKSRSIPHLRQRRCAILEALQNAGAKPRFVNGGGTGSLESTSQESGVTEVASGSAFFSPVVFDHYQHFKHQPAAAFAIEIVRHPKADTYTCLGGGYVASGGLSPEKIPQPYLPVGASLTEFEAAGEVQTPIVYTGDEPLKLGDPIFMRHGKAGELCEHFNSLYLVRQGHIVDEVKTYRGEGYKFL